MLYVRVGYFLRYIDLGVADPSCGSFKYELIFIVSSVLHTANSLLRTFAKAREYIGAHDKCKRSTYV